MALDRLSATRLEQLPNEIVALTTRVAIADAVAHERNHTQRALERNIDILESTLGFLRGTFPSRAASRAAP